MRQLSFYLAEYADKRKQTRRENSALDGMPGK